MQCGKQLKITVYDLQKCVPITVGDLYVDCLMYANIIKILSESKDYKISLLVFKITVTYGI